MSIGTLNEGPLHATLKATYVANGGDAEVPIDGFVADAVREGVIYEIQTGSFSGLGRKLSTLVERGPVVLVHPIAQTSYIVKLDDTGELLPRRKSPKHGALISILNELVYIPKLLNHPHFSIEVVLTEEEELRRFDPKKNRRRGGWRVMERRLLKVVDGIHLESAEDLLGFLVRELDEPFTTRDLAEALDQPVAMARKMVYCLKHTQVADVIGKQGNTLLYALNPRVATVK